MGWENDKLEDTPLNQNQDTSIVNKSFSSVQQGEFPQGGPVQEVLPKRVIRSTFSLLGLGLFAMLALQQIISFLLIVLMRAVAPHWEETGWFFWAVSYIPLYFIAYPVMLSIWRKVPNRLTLPYPNKKLPGYASLLLVAGCFALTYALNLISMLIAQGLSLLTGSEIVNPLVTALGSGNLWLNLFVVTLVAPIMEELIFRLFLYKKLACFGGRVYVFFSAILFAAFHVNIYQILYAFVLGVVMAVITYHTGTIRHSIFLHICVNFLGGGGTPLILHYAGESGTFIMSLVIVLILAAGIFAIVWWFYKGCPWMDFGVRRYTISPTRMMIFNPGVMLYFLLVLALMILQMIW